MHCNVSEIYHDKKSQQSKEIYKVKITFITQTYLTFAIILGIPCGCSQSVEVPTCVSVPIMQPHATEFRLPKQSWFRALKKKKKITKTT